jgi:hypothetical protein
MVESNIKAGILDELDNSVNVVEHYPTIKLNDNKETINELVLFYSKKSIFKNKIYIIQLDKYPIIMSDFPNPYYAWNSQKAVNDLVEKHHEITKASTDDIELNIKLIENGMEIIQIYFSEKSLRNEIERIRLLIENLI